MRNIYRIVKILTGLVLIAALTGCAATHSHESTGQYVDDSVITTKVKAAIFDEASLKVFDINVKTYKGIVQLSGFVNSTDTAARAGEVAGRIEGVISVRNDLIVK